MLTDIGFKRVDRDHSVYIYRRGDMGIMVPVRGTRLASNPRTAIQQVKASSQLNQGPVTWLLGIKIDHDRTARLHSSVT